MLETAPLLDLPQARIPEGGEAFWFTGHKGAKLRAALFPARGEPRGSVVLSSGRTEVIEKYFETIEDFQRRGFAVLIHDWRGQGLSARALKDRLRGHADGYEAFLADYEALLQAFGGRLLKPWAAVGHSMGGCLTLLALAHGQAKHFEGAVLSAPMLGINMGGLPPLAARGLSFANNLWRSDGYLMNNPGKPFDTDFDANRLTHDRTRFQRTCDQWAANKDLALGAPTWGWLEFALKATAWLARPENLKGVTIPVVICSAEQDKLVDNAAQEAAVRNLPNGRLVNVPGAYHEILMETDAMRDVFFQAFDALFPSPQGAPTAEPLQIEEPQATKPELMAAAASAVVATATEEAAVVVETVAAAALAVERASDAPATPKRAAPKKAGAAKATTSKTAAKPKAATTATNSKAETRKPAAKSKAAAQSRPKAAAKPASAAKAKTPAKPKAAAKPKTAPKSSS